jgi:hypothetical protein
MNSSLTGVIQRSVYRQRELLGYKQVRTERENSWQKTCEEAKENCCFEFVFKCEGEQLRNGIKSHGRLQSTLE